MKKYLVALVLIVVALAGCGNAPDVTSTPSPVACVLPSQLTDELISCQINLEDKTSELDWYLVNMEFEAGFEMKFSLCEETVAEQKAALESQSLVIEDLLAELYPTPTPTPLVVLPTPTPYWIKVTPNRATSILYWFPGNHMDDDPVGVLRADHTGFAEGAIFWVHPNCVHGAYGIDYCLLKDFEDENYGWGWWINMSTVDILN